MILLFMSMGEVDVRQIEIYLVEVISFQPPQLLTLVITINSSLYKASKDPVLVA
jgi:hypothetical protein